MAAARDLEAGSLICSEALIIFGIHESSRRIHQNPCLFMKFKDFMGTLGVS
jgi:hypothetical protein